VVALAANPVLLHIGSELVTRSLLMTALYMRRGEQACSADEHHAIIDAIATMDERRAQKLMHAHLAACEARLALDRAGERPADLAAALRIKPKRSAAR
jgi:DNA-binding GntR family transcriptional regulator